MSLRQSELLWRLIQAHTEIRMLNRVLKSLHSSVARFNIIIVGMMLNRME